jgi:RsiW-degrading membrane proteinase PrsW (M82 family)
VPGHAIFSGVMGYYLGRAKVERGGGKLWRRGLAWAVALHGGYDFLIMAGTPFAYLVFPFILAGWLCLRSLFKRARAADARTEGERSYQDRLPPIL